MPGCPQFRQALHTAVDAFLATPFSAATHGAAKKAWLTAREAYGQAETFSFYGGLIDSAPEGRMNVEPMDESFVDSVKGKPYADPINNKKFVINRKNLIPQSEHGGGENMATDWLVIEFVL